MVSDFDDARVKCDQALQLARQIPSERAIAYCLFHKATLDFSARPPEEGRALLLQAVSIFERLGDEKGLGLVFSMLMFFAMRVGNFEETLTYGLQSLKKTRARGDRVGEAWTLDGLGTSYYETGDPARARQYYEQGLALFEELGVVPGIARTLTGLGTLHLSLGRYEDALPLVERSLALFEESDNTLGLSRALNDFGEIAHQRGDYAAALDYHQRSLALREAMNMPHAATTSLLNMGRVLRDQGKLEEARDPLMRALTLAEETQEKPKLAKVHYILADLLERLGQGKEALRHFRAYHDLHKEIADAAAEARFNRLQVQHQFEQAEWEAEQTRQRNEALRSQNAKLERLLAELHTAQAQLVQAEKMASLGRLTAGIAHEIKNPLNFVNNFAEINEELTRELREALANGESVDDLLDDLEQTARVINQHGKRADGIVRAMMQHASGGSGQRTLTDINHLVLAHIDLAYHGKRAQLPDLKVEIKRDLAREAPAVEVMPQEIGRVLLNVLGNAFDAVQERATRSDGSYIPTVTVSTRQVDAQVAIRVSDNGLGIVQEIQDRIFEPFFTTKPTGTGTGLGLSLSHEIVTQGHGGTLQVESEEGEGATFIITLPMNQTATDNRHR
jgi:signal transduction histidine kinase